MIHKRLIGCIAAAAAVVFALAGCSLIPSVVGFGQSIGSTAPKVGQCWDTTLSNAAAWVDWEGSAAVDCSGPHDLYTFSIGTITGITAKSWASSTNPDQPSDAVQAASVKACTLATLLPKLKWNQQLVDEFFFIPSKSAWAGGARWVRCDAGVLAYGTTLSSEALAKLPARVSTLVSTVSTDPKRYEFCIDSMVPADAAGPLSNNTFNRVADCRNNPDWALVGRGNLSESVGSPFPTGAVANADSTRVCSKYAKSDYEVWAAYLPQETTNGTVGTDREVTCWVGQNGSPASGGVA